MISLLAQTTQEAPKFWFWTNLSNGQLAAFFVALGGAYAIVGPIIFKIGLGIIRGIFGWQSEIDRLRAGVRANGDKIQSVAQVVNPSTLITPEIAAKVSTIANDSSDDTKMGMPAIK